MSVRQIYDKAKAENRAVLVGYLPAGFPSKTGCIEALKAMVDAGVDVVEIGLPYSDPVLDGPTIQKAADQALAGGTRIADVMATVEAVAATGASTLVMTYWNPVLRYGVEKFATQLADAGGIGLITPDLTPDSGPDWIGIADAKGLDKVFLAAPSTSDERLKLTAQNSRGFIYATAVMGVTGARETTSSLAPALVGRLREVTDLPIGVGLGVSNGDQAAEIGRFADGVIVGSAFVRCLLDASDEKAGVKATAALAADLAAGVRRR